LDNLFSPYIELRVAGAQVRNLFDAFDLWLSRKEPADVCEFALRKGLPDLGLMKDTTIEIWGGYDLNQSWLLFSGYVTDPRAPRFLCKDEAVKLFGTPIVQTFMDVAPQDVIRFGLRRAGVTDFNLDATAYPRKARFVASENVSDLVRRVNTTWGLKHDWYFVGRRFNWTAPVPQPGPVYSYQYGENIIDLDFTTDRDPVGQRPAGSTTGTGKLLTVFSPFVGHSQEIEVVWPEVKASRFFVETVRHFINDQGALRTEIHFRELEAA